jgi:NADPH:quinone reductase
MKAIGLTRYLPIDDPQSLTDIALPAPVPTGRDLLVAVHAVAVNPVDTKVRAPNNKTADKTEPAPRVLGWDAAGVVQATGTEVSLFKPGDRVFYAGDITRPGCNSQLQLVDERIAGRMPQSLDFAQAAALPLTTITAWEALFDRLGISTEGADAGKTLLVLGGAGGVGSIMIQLAKQLAKLTVIATASRPESIAWARALGSDHVIDHTQPLRPQIEAAGLKSSDFIACLNSTDQHFATMADLVAPQGKIVTIVENKGVLDMALLKSKSVTFAQEFMFTRSMFQTPDMIEQHRLLTRTAALIDAGALRTTVGQHLGRIDAANLRRAHALLEGGHVIGKLVLEGWND